MDTSRFAKCAVTLVAIVLCSACGGALRQNQGDMPAAQGDAATLPSRSALNATYVGKTLWVNGTPVTAARLNPTPRYMTIVPDRHGKRKRYEYIMNNYGTYADIFDYPKSDQQIGSIYHVGGQACTNVLYGYGKQIFWIVAAHGRIVEYRAPKKELKRLSDAVGMPSSCGMNASGDLAVGIFGGTGRGDVVIYKNASGSGTVMTTQLNAVYFDGYDANGNLFADGWNSSDDFQLVELPNGSNKFEEITTSNTVSFPGSIQWDGRYLTVVDQGTNAMYQYTVNGTTATLKGTVQLSAGDCSQTWIVKGLVYCSDAGNNDGEVFKYPAGGAPIAVFSGKYALPLGVTAVRK